MSLRVLSELVEGKKKKNKKKKYTVPAQPGEDLVPSAVSWLILPVVICLSQKILAYMILSVQENEVENTKGSSNERRTLT
jgi:hypothetical protein